ncbi:hypothetical protein [Phenylobacterium sp.]|jgi:hypothetical protein|uniref:hypothetical protein n=1 Tax=Phenylobacterium sp. TaxID=1871053 RepID=UPI002F3E3EBE
MSELHDLTPDERSVLLAALQHPLVDRDPVITGVCAGLCTRRLLQRAGSTAMANGWRGSPFAFVLTRDGWNWVMAERRAHAGPMRELAPRR